MRVNVYTEELLTDGDMLRRCEIVTADYVSARTGKPMTNYGLRIYLASSSALHDIPGRDDDRSAVTFWCGAKERYVFEFLEMWNRCATASTLELWRKKTEKQMAAAEANLMDAVVAARKGSGK